MKGWDGWTDASVEKPPLGLVVETKVAGYYGAEQQLKWDGRRWVTPGSRFEPVDYVPTHWRQCPPDGGKQ